eukprot:CAMPEP_0119371190 /NCGR_PEP_ID=MMETSP1334-20130426/17420_1 /TAXON_ID=127549 /ORGANISM="Calcidiscus leptoporus, Strain RCC1130" /LENGTH=50 /DNA_ID=CAMNT_0007388413 /DNA_START=266 /DNA_END=418 /DNA_ORIENTATION=+
MELRAGSSAPAALARGRERRCSCREKTAVDVQIKGDVRMLTTRVSVSGKG